MREEAEKSRKEINETKVKIDRKGNVVKRKEGIKEQNREF